MCRAERGLHSGAGSANCYVAKQHGKHLLTCKCCLFFFDNKNIFCWTLCKIILTFKFLNFLIIHWELEARKPEICGD